MRFVRRVKDFVKTASKFIGEALREIKLVICRTDLPRNPRWEEEGYPYENCWDIDEFFEEAVKAGEGSPLWAEARRIWWESYWRLLGKYRRGRPFFSVYEVVDGELRPVRDRQRWVLENIITAGIAHGIVPRWVREYTPRVYRVLYGPLAR